MRGSIRQRSKGSWEIASDIGKDPSTGRRRQHFETIRGNKATAQKRLAELLIEIGLSMLNKLLESIQPDHVPAPILPKPSTPL